ncbi:unnamed protein product [Caenorhabditis brenneri]
MTPKALSHDSDVDSFEIVENTKKNVCPKKKENVSGWMKQRQLIEKLLGSIEFVILATIILYLFLYALAIQTKLERLETEHKKTTGMISQLQMEIDTFKKKVEPKREWEEEVLRVNLRDVLEPIPERQNKASNKEAASQPPQRPPSEGLCLIILLSCIVCVFMYRSECAEQRKKDMAEHATTAQKK